MESITIVLEALSAGAAAMAKDTVSLVVKDAYSSLKDRFLSKFKVREHGETVLKAVETMPISPGQESIPAPELIDLTADPALLALAERLLELVGTSKNSTRFAVRNTGKVQGIQVGDGGTQNNIFSS